MYLPYYYYLFMLRAGTGNAGKKQPEKHEHQTAATYFFMHLHSLTIPFVYTCCPGRTRVSTQQACVSSEFVPMPQGSLDGAEHCA